MTFWVYLDTATFAIKSESGIALLLQSCSTQCLQSPVSARDEGSLALLAPAAGAVARLPRGEHQPGAVRVCTVYVLYCTVQELYGSDSALGARRPILDPGTLDRDGLEVGADSWAEASQVCAGIYLDIVISTFIPRRS